MFRIIVGNLACTSLRLNKEVFKVAEVLEFLGVPVTGLLIKTDTLSDIACAEIEVILGWSEVLCLVGLQDGFCAGLSHTKALGVGVKIVCRKGKLERCLI